MIDIIAPYKLHYKEITGSTNDDALALAREGCEHFTLVWAKEQTKGRGRMNRRWIADPGNLYWSVVLHIDIDTPPIETLAFVTALAVGDVAVELADAKHRVEYKWPNDVLIDGAKFSGTLIEGGSDLGYVIVGVGINLRIAPKAEDVMYPATCLLDAGANNVDVDELCKLFSEKFLDRYTHWSRHGIQGRMCSDYMKRIWRLGESYRVSFNAEKTKVMEGINRGIDQNGYLMLEMEDGSTKTIVAGDVLFPKE